jgi:hypothetical protein
MGLGVDNLAAVHNPATQLKLFLPILMTAPVFGFVCGFLLHSAAG